MSNWPKLVSLLATKCLYWGGGGNRVGYREARGGRGTSDQSSAWPKVVPNLAGRCLMGYIWPMVSLTYSSTTLGHYKGGYIWPKVSLTWCSTTLGYYMPLLGEGGDRAGWQWWGIGGTFDQRSVWPKVVLHLATRCLCVGDRYIWLKVSLTCCSTTLGH